MARPFPLSAVKAGMTRLLDKGGASRDSLYDLKDGYVTASRRMKIRPGTRLDSDALTGTFGVIGWHDQLWVFADHDVAMPSSLYALAILMHPTDTSRTLVDVAFAGAINGALYVAGVFDDGSCWHFYLEDGVEWSPETAYGATESLVYPTVANGFYYRPERLTDEYPAWTAGAPRTVGDRVEPTVANGYYYEVVSVEGTNPTSGATEPDWPVNDGQTITEDTAAGTSSGVTPPASGGGGGEDTTGPCVVGTAWLSDQLQAMDVTVDTIADLHDPELGFHVGRCTVAKPLQLVACVRLTTSSGAQLECSVHTPVNFTSAEHDMQTGHWNYAPEAIGQSVWVEGVAEIVTLVEDIGEQLVKPLRFENGRSFGASRYRGGRRIYTHNMAKMT